MAPWRTAVRQLEGYSADLSFHPSLQALVYDILPSTTAVFSYDIGSGQLSANEHFVLFCFLCSNNGNFDYIRRLFYN